MSLLTFKTKDREGRREIALSGVIDENANYGIADQIKHPNMIFDFEQVRAINSHGVKYWIDFIRKFSGSKISYERCPAVIIDAINMIQPMRAGVDVKSFYLPFVCRVCNKEHMKLVTREEATVSGFVENVNECYPCPTCGRHLEFQDDESVYFDFLAE